MPYTPTWNNPYMPTNPYQQVNIPTSVQPMGYQQPMNEATQVSGPESALQYGQRMPPNSTSRALFNTNGKVFYIVSTDGAGVPTLETFDFAPHKDEPAAIDTTQYVSRGEFNALSAKVNEALGAINGIHESISAAESKPARARRPRAKDVNAEVDAEG